MHSVELNNIITQIKNKLTNEYAVISPCRSENLRVVKIGGKVKI